MLPSFESYGVALARVAHEGGTDMMACIHDKGTGRAELSTPSSPWSSRGWTPRPAPGTLAP